jgi:multiple sugar transport system substrate-binding protein
MKAKKLLLVVLSGLIALNVGFLACGTVNAKSKSPSKPKLTAWILKTWSEETNKGLYDRMIEFGKANKVDITPVIINSSDISQKFNAAISSGMMPDVTFCMPFYLRIMEDKKLCLDITSVVKEIEKKSGKFYSAGLEYGKDKGKNYAFPIYNETRVLFCRMDLLKAAGYDNPPKTWNELRTMAKAITNKEKGIYGFGDALALTDDCENNQRTYLWSWGGQEVKPDSKTVAINSQQTIAMVRFFTDMLRVDKSMPETVVNWDDSGNNTAYISGQCAMVVNTPTILAALDKPELKHVLNNTKLAPIPAGPAGLTTYGNSVFYMASSKTKYPAQAKALLKYLMNKEWYSSWIKSAAPVNAPSLQDVANQPFFKQYPQDVCVAGVSTGKYLGYPGKATLALNRAYTERLLGNTYQNILINHLSVEDAVANWEKSLKGIMNSK